MNILKITLIAVLTIIPLIQVCPQSKTVRKNFFISLGTSLSSFAGGDFGGRFAIRYSRHRDRDNYYNSSYYSSYDDSYRLNPLQFDISTGYILSNYVSFELESSFLWHTHGRPDPVYETGTVHNEDYIERYDNSHLFAIPVILSVKVFPLSASKIPFYLSAGAGAQYTRESIERIREYYDYNYHYGYYGYYSYEYPIAEYTSDMWMKAVRLGAGFSYNFWSNLSGVFEVRYTGLFLSGTRNSPLAMHTTPYTGNIAISTKVYFRF